MIPCPVRRPTPTRRAPRARALVLVAVLAAGLAGCGDDDATAPAGLAARVGFASDVAGTWVYDLAEPSQQPSTRAGTVVADTLRLGARGAGRWAIAARAWPDPTVVDRNVVDVRWTVLADTVQVSPTCEPAALCDPAGPWRGTVLPDGRLFLHPYFINGNVASRLYRKVDP